MGLTATNEYSTNLSGGSAHSSVPLRIAITTDPEIPVPPLLYGGIERIVDMLVRGLVERGHEVTLFAHPESNVPCRLVPYRGLRGQSKRDILTNMLDVASEVRRARVDVATASDGLRTWARCCPVMFPRS